MGLLNIFSKPTPDLLRLPSGSFTVDREGKVLVSTITFSFPQELLRQVGSAVLATFHEAAAAQLVLSEISIRYPNLKITARELRGGAIVFLSPQAPFSPTKTS